MNICKKGLHELIQEGPCLKCRKISDANWYLKNKHVRLAWYLKNKDRKSTSNSKYYFLHKDQHNASTKTWKKSNPGKCNAYWNKYYVSKLQATPKWLSKEQLDEITEFYTLAQELAWLNQDGKAFHVDHIIPLQGENVCGLHVPWNLQLLPANENKKKGNKL
jgi:hypothetical protein